MHIIDELALEDLVQAANQPLPPNQPPHEHTVSMAEAMHPETVARWAEGTVAALERGARPAAQG